MSDPARGTERAVELVAKPGRGRELTREVIEHLGEAENDDGLAVPRRASMSDPARGTERG